MASKAVLAKVKSTPRRSITKKKAAPKIGNHWYIVLQIVDGKARAQPDWSTNMKVGDTVQFLSPDGKVKAFVIPKTCKDKLGRTVTLTPFGADIQPVRGPRKVYHVINSCKSLLNCMVVDKNNRLINYSGVVKGLCGPEIDDDDGSTWCTGGTGNSQVNCTPRP